MASAFLGGVAASLQNSLNTHQQAKKSKEDWEWKEKKAQELEEQAMKRRPVKTETFEKDGQYFTQSYNALGEPLGEPIPAGTAQVEAFKRGDKERSLRIRAAEADIEKAEAQTRAAQTEIDFADDRFNLDKRKVDIDAAQAASSAGYSSAAGEFQRELAREKRIMNDALESGDMSILDRMKGLKGRGGASAEDEARDWKVANDLVNDVAQENEILAEELREDMEEMQRLGKTAAEISAYVVSRTRQAKEQEPEPDISDQMSRPIQNWRTDPSYRYK